MEATAENMVSSRCCHLVALPYPGRGHINPMLNLCRHLTARRLVVTVVVTDEWLQLLSSSSSSAAVPPEPASPNFRLLSIPDILPSERCRGADLWGFIHEVMTKMQEPVEALLAGLDPPADAVLADSFLPWAAAIGRGRGIPVAALFTQAATEFLAVYELDGHGAGGVSGKGSDLLDYIPRPWTQHKADTIRVFRESISWSFTAQSLLFPSFYELERHAIDTLRSDLSIPIHPIGPAIPYLVLEGTPTESYYKWLDSQPECSVLYVSLGSFLPVADAQMEEIAMGLNMSGCRFLWAVHGESTRLEELSGGMGSLVPWCEQLRVLCHPSAGGFLTHCGWNSTLEAVYAGVPVLTFPLIWDQFPNSKLMVDQWKVGWRLKDDKEERVVGREEIAETVRKLMDLEAGESKELRRRVRELKEVCHMASKDDGSSVTSIEAFVEKIIPQTTDDK